MSAGIRFIHLADTWQNALYLIVGIIIVIGKAFRGKTFEEEPETLKDIVNNNDATLYASFNEAFIDLENKRIDGLLVDLIYAEYYLTQAGKGDNFNLVETAFEQEEFAVGVRKADEKLAEKINDGFATLKENGTFKELGEKWFGEDISE